MIQLRPYQSRAIAGLRALIRKGKRRPILVAPTGSGKTICFSYMTAEAAAKGNHVLIIAHRQELVDQAHSKLASFGIDAGVMMGADKRTDWAKPVQVACIDTLRSRLKKSLWLPSAQLVIADECHMALSAKWLDVLSYYASSTIVGATATPWRTDKQGLADVFDGHVVAATVAELMASGALVYADYFAWDAPDLHEAKTVRGDWKEEDLELACNTEILVGNACEEYGRRARGRRALTFAVSIAHSENLVSRFLSLGIRAQHVDCNTKRANRIKAIKAFERREIEVLSSVDLFSVGFDCPPADTALLCRPTKSLPLHLQQVGRVLRPYDGKIRALVLDHAGNLIRHGFAEDERDMTPGPTPQSVIARKTCPCCFTLFTRLEDGRCPTCGEIIGLPPEPREESKGRKQKEEVDGKMIDAAAIARMRGKGIRDDLSDRQALRAANATPQEKKSEYRRLVDICRDKKIKLVWASHRFRETFGHWPNYGDDEISTVEPARKPFFPLPPKTEEKKPLWQSAPPLPDPLSRQASESSGKATSSEKTQQEIDQMKLGF